MIFLVLLAAGSVVQSPLIRVTKRKDRAERSVSLSPAEMFEAASLAQRKGELGTAEAIYRALCTNPSLAIRNEARFRLAELLRKQRRVTDAALLLRRILDEEPNAQAVRLALVELLTSIGDEAGARKELRAVEAGQLPPEVARQVDRFSEALRSRKPLGATVQVAMASDSNINRATRSDTLGTVIGDFTLDKDARAQSGEGVAVQTQGYARVRLGRSFNLLGTLSASGDLYRKSRFNDVAVGGNIGPEASLGSYELHVSAGASRRWYGAKPFTDAATLQLDVAHPVAPTVELRGSLSGSRIWNHLNTLESGHTYSGMAGFEAALSPTTGGGLSFTAIRQQLRDDGYSTWSGQAALFGWHDLGRVTLAANLGFGRLKADERLLLYLDRRNEALYHATLGATVRRIQFKGFAPTVSFTWERNRSSIEIYDYRRTVVDLGLTRAF
jgi:hypothetical protein